jgi:hypothetical protein
MKFVMFLLSLLLLSACGLSPPIKKAILFTPKEGSNMLWRLEIRDAVGTLKYTKGIADVFQTLDSFTIGEDGDCLEANFKALGSSLGIAARDIVILQTSPTGVIWINRYAGVAIRVGANNNPDYSQFKLVGLRKRLQEVELRSPQSTGDVGTIARQVVQDAIATGQLGSAVIYDSSLIPLTGFLMSGFASNYRSVAAVLDYLASAIPGTSWGINADRKVFFGVATGTVAIDESVTGTLIQWEDANAEHVYNAVRWMIAQLQPPDFLAVTVPAGTTNPFSGYELEEGWLTRLSQRATTIGTSVQQFTPPPETLVAAIKKQTGGTVTFGNGATALVNSGNVQDGTSTAAQLTLSAGGLGAVRVEYSSALNLIGMYLDLPDYTKAFLVRVRRWNATYGDWTGSYATTIQSNNVKTTKGFYFMAADEILGRFWDAGHNRSCVEIYFYEGTASQVVNIGELRAVTLDSAFLDNIAQNTYRSPAQDPATAVIQDIIAPGTTANITRRNPNTGAILATLTRPAKSFEYKITLDDYTITTIKIGQEFDPEQEARDAIIKARDNLAAVEAVRVATRK